MSKVRLLVGTKKGAFILTADGKRVVFANLADHSVDVVNFDGTGLRQAAFWRVGDVSPEGIAGECGADLCVAVERVVWADYTALE